ncbi:helix-turn-helix transcriptional regulator [Streptococcus suis]|uniref:helix-turn-helix transcriptional regulator n=1 Tax=Streptococcus suis TaxID=1307 RepID=UPI001ABE0DBB|nr:helix-turn-helix transcriptional regulator [Streptococcus suis]
MVRCGGDMIKKKWLDKHAPKLESEPYAEGTVKDLRLKLGMTQKELAELLGVPKTNVGNWEFTGYNPPEVLQKLQKIYDDTKALAKDDGIDIIEKVSYIRHRLGISYDKLAQLIGSRHGTTVKGWMEGRKPQMKYMAEINRMYYELKGQHKTTPQKRRPTFCQINQLDKASWKVKIENPVIVWR